jgi:RHS repeat-associated protein
LNRLTKKTYPDNSTVIYTYDNDSRLTQVVDPTGTYQFGFDNMGRLSSTTTNYTFLTSRSFTTAYGYDAASNRTSFTDPESGATGYGYDTLNRLQTLTPPSAFGTGNFGFGYDNDSRRTSLTRPNSVNTTYGYDTLSRLLSVTHKKGTSTLDGATYTLDNAGNRMSRTPLPSGTATNFTYDSIYELLTAKQGKSTTESYTYDAVGNRLTSSGTSYTNNSSNELTAVGNNTTYTYDNNGNTLTKVVSGHGGGTTTYAWDFENRLTSITLPGSGGTVSFKYDPFGRRIYKSSSSGTSVFAYDGDNLVEETNSSGAVVAGYSENLTIDEPLVMLRTGVTSFYQADGLGSVTSLSNGAGALAQTYTFDSFGKTTASSGSLTNPFRFTARDFDTETNLQFSRARYYDPSTGRFLSEDPIGFNGGFNFYQYVGNSSTNLVDQLGLQSGTTYKLEYDNMKNNPWPATPFLEPRHLSDCAKKILQPYFPGLNLDGVGLMPRLPGFTKFAPIDVAAITWDGTISYQPGFFSGSAGGLAALGHELTHVQQQSSGLGSFLGGYVGDYLKNLLTTGDPAAAYEKTRAEKEANQMETKILGDLLRKFGLNDPCKDFCK